MPERKYQRLRRPRSLLKSQKKLGPSKFAEQSRAAEPKEPLLDAELAEDNYEPRFTLKDRLGDESTIDRILRRGASISPTEYVAPDTEEEEN